MPGVRAFGQVGVPSPVLDTFALRYGRQNAVDLRRQQRQQTPPQYSQQVLQQSVSGPAQKTESDRAGGPSLPQAFVKPGLQPTIPEDVPHQPSTAESRFSGASSGSEHEPSSEYLADLVSNFMEVEESRPTAVCADEDDQDAPSGSGDNFSTVQDLSTLSSPLESNLFADVLCALQLSCTGPSPSPHELDWSAQVNGAAVRRAVMCGLRTAGYNAAVCKSRWDHSRGFPGGDYEYIDVTFSQGGSPIPRERLIVDLDFRAQFQVARPTPEFEAALQAAPVIFVGRPDRLQQLVEALADACRRSLKRQGMHLPPWRKVEYLRAKWLSPYKRTTNPQSQPAALKPLQQQVVAPAFAAVPLRKAELGFSRPVATPSKQGFGFTTVTARETVPPVTAPRNCSSQRNGTAPRGVLGMLLQENASRK